MQSMIHRGSRQVREFSDSRKRAWRVFEREKTLLGQSLTVLVFESDSSFRTVRSYPPDWYDLQPDMLEALSERL